MSCNLVFIFLLLKLLFHGIVALEDYPHVKVCDGVQTTGVTGGSDPVSFLKMMYENCTHITHHLIIHGVKENHDVSFLKSIVDVGGILKISKSEVSRLSLPNLKVVRGKYLFKYKKTLPAAAVYIISNKWTAKSQTGVLDLRSFHSVIRGSIVVEENTNFCFLTRVDWEALSEEQKPHLRIFRNSCGDDGKGKSTLSKCSTKCPLVNGKRYCWGPDRNQCQQLSPSCSHCSQNAKSRCYLSKTDGTRRCCSNWCVGGCFNRSASACYSCKNVINGKKCLGDCPPENIVVDFKQKPNPNFRRVLDSFCVKQCPKTFYTHGRICVKVCPSGTRHENLTCTECPKDDDYCKGYCNFDALEQSLPPQQRSKHSILSRFTLQKLVHCTTLQTTFILIDVNKRLPKNEQIREEDLNNLRNLEKITGCLQLNLEHLPGVKSLSFLANLTSLSCTSSTNGLDVINGANLLYLDLRKLTDLRVNKVSFFFNPKLCYLEHFRRRFVPTYKKIYRLHEVPSEEKCKKNGHRCDALCDPAFGCWGPGHKRCVRCLKLRAGGACVSSCQEEPGFYMQAGKCHKCHDECRNCTGPSERDCVGKCRHVQLNDACMRGCPWNAFNDAGICRPCAASCRPRNATLCSGAKDVPGRGGCNYCIFIEANRNLQTGRCLALEEVPSGFYVKTLPEKVRRQLFNFTDKSSRLVIRCDPACLKCTDSKPNACDLCAKGYRLYEPRQCVKKCPPKSFEVSPSLCKACHHTCKGGCNGTSASDCFACSNYKLWSRNRNSTQWKCVEKCPKEQPFMNPNPRTDEIWCSPDKLQKGSISLALLSVIPLLLLIGGSLCCLYQRRRRRAYEKDQEALREKYILPLEQEMVPLASSNVAPNFGQIRVFGSKSLQKFGKLGVGAFGTVYRGRWTPEMEEGDEIQVKIDVAIKELRTATASDSQKFLAEAYVMATVNNPFCVHLLGVCLTSPMQLISEFVPLGNLTSYVPRHRQSLSSRIYLTWALQIARGMAYLESRGIVHRDLAARNVLLQRENLVRITDFGLAKLLDSSDELKSTACERLPVAWLAIESLIDLAFSHKSDVWAYGVTLWEIFTFCESRPYSRMQLSALVDFLDSGERLKQPESCTLELYLLLLKCWVRDASGRPTFEEIVEEVKGMAADPDRFLCLKDRPIPSKAPKTTPAGRSNSLKSASLTDDDYERPISSRTPAGNERQLPEEDDDAFEDENSAKAYLLPDVGREPTYARACGDGYLAVTSSPT